MTNEVHIISLRPAALFAAQHCHSMNRGINALYFRGEQIDEPWGYRFFSKHSKTKDKNVVLSPAVWEQRAGEHIQINKFKGAAGAIEVVYHLPTLFDRAGYANQKAFQNRVKTPTGLITKLELAVARAQPSDLDEIKALHDEWVVRKLDDPRVHRITFSKNRYWNCVDGALTRDDSFVYVVRDRAGAGDLVSCRVICKASDTLFDAANFVSFWSKSQLSAACNVATLLRFREEHPEATWFNTGLASGTLKAYKQHFPNKELKVWRAIVKPTVP